MTASSSAASTCTAWTARTAPSRPARASTAAIAHRGYGLEAKILVLRYAFLELRFQKYEVRCQRANDAMVRHMARLGATLEGRSGGTSTPGRTTRTSWLRPHPRGVRGAAARTRGRRGLTGRQSSSLRSRKRRLDRRGEREVPLRRGALRPRVAQVGRLHPVAAQGLRLGQQPLEVRREPSELAAVPTGPWPGT